MQNKRLSVAVGAARNLTIVYSIGTTLPFCRAFETSEIECVL